MKIPVSNLKRDIGLQSFHSFEQIIPPLADGGDSAVFQEPVKVEASLTNTGDSIHADVRIEGKARLRCGRCLEEFVLPIDSRFRVKFKEGAEPGDEGDEDVTPYSGDSVDLAEDVRQNVIVSLPMRPLCNEGCKGLCPHCGCNLNTGACACDSEPRDIRMSVLQDWVEARKGQGSES